MQHVRMQQVRKPVGRNKNVRRVALSSLSLSGLHLGTRKSGPWKGRRKVMRKAQRRRFWLYTVVTVFAQPLASEALAQSYPNKPVRMVGGVVAGGGTDVTARLVAQKLSEHLGQPVVVENRPGASTAIGTERVAKSPTDGYTLLMLSCTTSVLSAMRTNLPYDLERDFAPVSMVTTAPLVLLVHPSVPARDVKEL